MRRKYHETKSQIRKYFFLAERFRNIFFPQGNVNFLMFIDQGFILDTEGYTHTGHQTPERTVVLSREKSCEVAMPLVSLRKIFRTLSSKRILEIAVSWLK